MGTAEDATPHTLYPLVDLVAVACRPQSVPKDLSKYKQRQLKHLNQQTLGYQDQLKTWEVLRIPDATVIRKSCTNIQRDLNQLLITSLTNCTR